MLDRVSQFSVVIIATLATAFTLYFTKGIVIPFILAVFLHFLLTPLFRTLEKRYKLPRWLSLLLLLLVSVGIFALLILITVNSVQGLIKGINLYADRLTLLVGQTTDWVQQFGVTVNKQALLEAFRKLPFFSYFQAIAGTTLQVVTTGLLSLIFLFFLSSGSSIASKKQAVFFDEVTRKIQRYLGTKLISSTLTATLVGIILVAFKLELAFMFIMFVFLLNFIPSIGSVIATLIPIPIALLQYDSLGPVIAILILTGAIQFTIGNLLEPKFLGQTLDLHPVTILLSLMVWGVILGPVGMFISVPLAVVIKIVLEKTSWGSALAQLMAGRL